MRRNKHSAAPVGQRAAPQRLAALALVLAGCSGGGEPIGVDLPGQGRVGAVLLSELQAAVDAASSAHQPLERAALAGDLGSVLTAYELYDPAAQALEIASGLAPTEFRWWYLLGYVEFQRGEMASAAAAWERACALAPEDVPCAARRTQALLQLGQVQQAQQELTSRLQTADDVAYVRLLRGDVASALGDWHLAIGEYTEALALQPGANALHRLLARAEQMLGNADTAREHLAKVGPVRVALDDPWMTAVFALDESPTTLMERGREALSAGDRQEAKRLFQEAARRAPTDPAPPYNEGVVLLQERDIEGAMRAFGRALDLEPVHLDALLAQGALLTQRGDAERGAALLRRALDNGSLDPQVRLNLGNAYLTLERPSEALEQFSALLADPAAAAMQPAQRERIYAGAVRAASRSGDDGLAVELAAAGCQSGCGLALRLAQVRLLAASRVPGTTDPPRALELATSLRAQSNDAEIALAYGLALIANRQFDQAAAFLGELQRAAQSARQAAIAGRAGRLLRLANDQVEPTSPDL